MNLVSTFNELKILSFALDNTNTIQGVSTNLASSDDGKSLVGRSIFDIVEELFVNDGFSNQAFYDSFKLKLQNCIDQSRNCMDEITVSDANLTSNYFYRFSMGIDVFSESSIKAIVKFANFNVLYTKDDMYRHMFDDFEEEFESISSLHEIGYFIIDYSEDANILFGNDPLPKLLNINKSPNNKYQISRNIDPKSPYAIVREPAFYLKVDLLLSGDIKYLTDEWIVDDRFLQLEARILKYDENSKPLLLGGIVRDVTNYRDFKNLKHLQSIYDLAISSGGIGIFHYNMDLHGKDYFEVNDNYAKLIGIEANEMGLYNLDDFKAALLDVEQELSTNLEVRKTINKIMQGEVDGTNDDIIKIKNLKTEEIHYLLSSSEIESRHEDGTPNIFGGIIIDITERIKSEKNKIEFAYTDELTRLPNNRKLMKDMSLRKSGVGLFFDLDNFKKINDQYGHLTGDMALKIFASALTNVTDGHNNIFPYRLYGDEFFVFIEGGDQKDALRFEKLAKKQVSKLVPKLNIDIKLEASMGISAFDTNMDIDDFIKKAYYSMYESKIAKKQL